MSERIVQVKISTGLARWVKKYAKDEECAGMEQALYDLIVRGLWGYYNPEFAIYTPKELASLSQVARDLGVHL